jgi:branched-chain amino acid transport system permease protein
MLAQQLLNGVVVGSVYALFALGFTLIFGVNHILNLAHGAVFTWGALAALYTVTAFELPLPIAILAAALTGGCLGLLLDAVAFRPLRSRNAPEFAAIISSIGAGLILTSLAQQASETRVLRFPFGTFPAITFQFLGLRIQLLQLVIIAAVAILVALLSVYLYRTSFGRQVRAVSIDERTARLLGINPSVVLAQVFFISGALAGLAGVLIGLAFNSVHFMMGEPFLLRAFVVIVLGGLGSLTGAVLAGLSIGVVQSLSVAYLSSGFADAIVFTLLFIALVVRPTGLFGRKLEAVRAVRQ